ncbi:MAG: SDR family oxidoreductase [Anaerolineae bacterium]
MTTLLVTGASGHLGRRVLELLLEAGETHIIATTRTPEKLADFAARGVTVRTATFDDPESLRAAFTGADRLLLISTDALGVPGLRERQHRTAIEAAAAVGVKHVVYTSLVNPVNTPIPLAPDHAATEAALESSTLGYTILRNNVYADGLPGMLTQALGMGGKLFSAVGDGKIAYVTREDCARAAAAALAASFEGRRVLDVTGPEAISHAELAAIGTAVYGQPITYIPLSVEVMTQQLVQAGLPEPIAQLIVSFDDAGLQGKLNGVSAAVQDLTGQPAMRIADFIAAQPNPQASH